MRIVEYYKRPSGREPAREWVKSQDNSIRPSIYNRIDHLKTDDPQDLVDRGILVKIKGKGRKKPSFPGFFELKHKTNKWRIAVYYEQRKNTIILLHGWRKDPKTQDAEIDKARTLLYEYMGGGT